MVANYTDIEKRLWSMADELRANSKLKASEYSLPVLGLIFLRYADVRFADAERELAGTPSGRRTVGPVDYQAKGVLYLPPEARFVHLQDLPECHLSGYTGPRVLRLAQSTFAGVHRAPPRYMHRRSLPFRCSLWT